MNEFSFETKLFGLYGKSNAIRKWAQPYIRYKIYALILTVATFFQLHNTSTGLTLGNYSFSVTPGQMAFMSSDSVGVKIDFLHGAWRVKENETLVYSQILSYEFQKMQVN